ncbi:hypothetical protein AK812_SmicGene9133 [Symbiodinium microadriaticum]|uniref:Uncharacterized protein n=1 Tax=Symbiodinium microadriaticum TaxID=2951 RepID=A0A1Q9EJ25_SYMMI|nr:hypothetical protein AK812_SmicGene9133 [Symbiodinium microadriaticum]
MLCNLPAEVRDYANDDKDDEDDYDDDDDDDEHDDLAWLGPESDSVAKVDDDGYAVYAEHAVGIWKDAKMKEVAVMLLRLLLLAKMVMMMMMIMNCEAMKVLMHFPSEFCTNFGALIRHDIRRDK